MPAVLFKEPQPSIIGEATSDNLSGEVMAHCPVCKAFQTLWLTNGRLMATRKFRQDGNRIYHDCGSIKPCQIYRTA